MAAVTEIRWHSRGGQGAKTAATLLAEAASSAGMYVQGFPEYGPERMGAPMLAFNRLSKDPIYVHSHVEEPGFVMVLDPSLIGKVDVTDGMRDGGAVIVNTGNAPREMAARPGDRQDPGVVVDDRQGGGRPRAPADRSARRLQVVRGRAVPWLAGLRR